MSRTTEVKLAENLKKIMAEKRLTITHIAQKARINKSTLHGYCNGVVPRNLPQLRSLADFLEVPFDELLFGRVQEEAPLESENKIEGRYELIIRRISE